MSGTDLTQRTPSQELVARVRSEEFAQQVKLALPEGVSERRFARIAVTAIQTNTDLGQCTPESVSQALLRCAADGLYPDGREAALVKFGNAAQYMPMIGGFRKIAADHGWTIRTRVVYANDDFDWTEEPPAITHRRTRPGADPGDLVYAYGIAEHVDGRRMIKVLDRAEIEKRKAVARSKNVWDQWQPQMWEKTAGRDLFGELPLGDLDEARIRLLMQSERAFEEATTDPVAALYGVTEIPPADGNHGGGSQQAGTAASPSSAAVPAPGIVEEGEWVPIDEDDDAAMLASCLVVPAGVHQGKTFAEVAAEEHGPGWFLTQLKRVPAEAPARKSIEVFVAAALPDVWTRYEAWKNDQ